MTKREMEKLEVLNNETEEGNRQVALSKPASKGGTKGTKGTKGGTFITSLDIFVVLCVVIAI